MSGNDAALSAEDRRLFNAVDHNDDDAAEAVQQAIRDGANVNAVVNYSTSFFSNYKTPLMKACKQGYDEIVRILLDAGADARWRNSDGQSAVSEACWNGHLSTVQLLVNHDNGILEITDHYGITPLHAAHRHPDIVQFLLDRGADPHRFDCNGETAFMFACHNDNLEIVRLLLAVGVDVEARNQREQTALHYAVDRGHIEVVRELISQHNANMFASNDSGNTPFEEACILMKNRGAVVDHLLEMYGNKLTQDHGPLALHELLKVAEYFLEDYFFHPPLSPLVIILPLGDLTLKHLRTLLHTWDPELFRNRDDTGKLPFHIACRTNSPVEVLALILELDPAALHIADSTGALPIHLLCGTTAIATEYASVTSPVIEYASVRYLVEQGGVGILAARDRQGLLPLHILCGSTDPPLRAVQYLIQSFPASLAMQTNAGQYPFMMAAAAYSSSASLSVVYELVRANPGLVVPR